MTVSTITANLSNGIALTSAVYGNPLEVASGVTILAGGSSFALFAADPWAITNDGTLSALSDGGIGLELQGGGAFTNRSDGVVTAARTAIYAKAALDVVNAGLIEAAGATSLGMQLAGGGMVSNTGTITGRLGGIASAGVLSVNNDGLIAAISTLAREAGIQSISGTVVNTFNGVVQGYTSGVSGVDFTVNNDGLIQGISQGVGVGIDLSGTGFISNTGTISGALDGVRSTHGTITNQVSGLIAGYFGAIDGVQLDITNAGTINAIGGGLGGSAIRLSMGGTIVNDATGTISGVGLGIQTFGGAVTNAGTISGIVGVELSAASLDNTGTITGSSISVYGSLDAIITNSGVIDGQNGVGLTSGAQLVNSGMIGGYYGVGVYGGLTGIVNVANTAGAAIAGRVGVYIDGTASLTNAGSISSSYSYGVQNLYAGTVIVNRAGGSIAGGRVGVGLAAAATVTNSGSISGSSYGVDATAAVTLTNAGTIGGGTAAVALSAGNSTVIVDAGAVFLGNVVANPSYNNTLELASGISAGTLSGLGGQFTGFEQTQVDAGATWTLTGSNTMAAGQILTNAGALILSDGSLLNDAGAIINDGQISVAAGTLDAASLAGNGRISVDAGGTLAISGAVYTNAVLTFNGAGGKIELSDPAVMAGTIGGFGVGDTLDLTSLSFSNQDSVALLLDNVLQISDGLGSSYDLQLDPAQNLTNDSFSLAAGSQGTDVVFSPPPTPPAPTVFLDPGSDGGLAGDNLTNIAAPILDGSGVAGDSVTVFDGGSAIGTATVGSGGTWSLMVPTLLDGLHTLTATQTIVGSSPSAAATLALTIDTTIPAPTSLGQTRASGLTGMAAPGTTVTFSNGNSPIGTAAPDASGAWFFLPSLLAAGSYAVTATVADVAGNVSAPSSLISITVAADHSFTIGSTAAGSTTVSQYNSADILSSTATTGPDGTVIAQTLAADGTLLSTDTTNAVGWLLQSVTPAITIRNIYDAAGNLIGTVTEAGSTTGLAPPNYQTAGVADGANTATDATPNLVHLLSENQALSLSGNDHVIVGAGNDTISGNATTGLIDAGSGQLTFYGDAGTSTVNGGSGTATIVGGTGGGLYVGGAAAGSLLVAVGGNTILVGAGRSDVIFGGAGQTTVFGSTGGGDSIVAGSGTNVIVAAARDAIFASSGHSTVFGSAAGQDTILGGGDNLLLAAGGENHLFGGASGSDTMFAGSGANTLAGGGGSDLMIGGTGSTAFVGGSGQATVFGGSGDDTVWTGAGQMTAVLGNGVNTVILGSGNATLYGGAGPTSYDIIQGHAGGNDVISGFRVATDQISLFGYATGPTEQVLGGSTVLTLSDGAHITLLNVTGLNNNSII